MDLSFAGFCEPFAAHQADFLGETPAGAAVLVDKLQAALKQRFPGRALPRVLMTDRGKGFFRTNNAAITPEYKEALARNDCRSFLGGNASKQYGNLSDSSRDSGILDA